MAETINTEEFNILYADGSQYWPDDQWQEEDAARSTAANLVIEMEKLHVADQVVTLIKRVRTQNVSDPVTAEEMPVPRPA